MVMPGNRRKKGLFKNKAHKGRSETSEITKTLTATQKRQRVTNPKANVTFSKKKLRQKNKRRDIADIEAVEGVDMVDAPVDKPTAEVKITKSKQGTVLGAPSS
eukprot:CFRG2190T1